MSTTRDCFAPLAMTEKANGHFRRKTEYLSGFNHYSEKRNSGYLGGPMIRTENERKYFVFLRRTCAAYYPIAHMDYPCFPYFK